MSKKQFEVLSESSNVVVINADDFGYDEAHTIGIIRAFEEGLITNTTIMVNMPYFNEACEYAEQYGVKDRVGLHLNLVEGTPLTEGIKKCSTFCDENGNLHGLWRKSVIKTSWLSAEERTLLREEILAQFMLFEQKGFTLKHFDTHGHSHTYFSVWRLLMSIIGETKWTHNVRLAKNLFDSKALSLKSLYKKVINCLIPRKMHCTDYFTDVRGYLKNASQLSADDVTEIMCHPCLVEGKIQNPGDLPITELTHRIPHLVMRHF